MLLSLLIAYMVIRQTDVVDIIKMSRAKKLECGRDFGLIAYNETPAYEVIDKGITSLSVDWVKMGDLAAQFIVTGDPVQIFLPTELHLRDSV
jgi:DNA-binding LacI/PurR family transcriptional regulator